MGARSTILGEEPKAPGGFAPHALIVWGRGLADRSGWVEDVGGPDLACGIRSVCVGGVAPALVRLVLVRSHDGEAGSPFIIRAADAFEVNLLRPPVAVLHEHRE